MATNPMQRKSRNSFLLGMVVMLLISGIIIALLFMQLMQKNKKEQEEKKQSVKAYVLNQDVKSGQEITTDMLTLQTVNKTLVPNNATSDIEMITNYSLTDKEGNNIRTIKGKDGEAKMVLDKNGSEYELKKEEETDNYYIIKNSKKEYVELNNVPLIAKVTMKKNTLITTELISKGDNQVRDDVRRQEYNMVVLPMDLTTGDYIDIRVMFPNRQDFIIVSKKEVEIPNVNGVDDPTTFWANFTEDEILHMSCAIIDASQVKGSKIYATKYTEAGMQKAAVPTYPISEKTSNLLQTDPNILEKSMKEIANRYNRGNSVKIRNENINPMLDQSSEEAKTNIETKMEENITKSINGRKEYLDSLSGTLTE